ncbi:LysR family transcriptional regulator [Paenibacillus radicis (ex Gao et al. 2016)]|uniref:LysR family transcriptional regulator n=1 Tax=Paenibacillus radicis (ex Gao et al. 2016) TaxID=1737354 RepID=A0A917HBK0_9BACL|nr:LysR family transcriptional regulator [Paenibacillus radicis (ex Gao et al. 2016)]GGG73556.1 LysR family transcriptional regulator [Paenibacillus radicis (ex Gao et al. 2016)]
MDQSLLVFMTVAEKMNFTRAAEALHMTQPAVSQHIQSLESAMGTKLLERSNKYVRLNEAGEIVYRHGKEIAGLYASMQSLVNDLMNEASGTLAIGASYTFGEYALPHTIAYLQHHYPEIKPTITIGNTKEIAELVAGRQLDIGIIEGELQHGRLHVEPFAKDRMYIVASSAHPVLGGLEDVSIDFLRDQTWIVREEGSGTREATERMFSDIGLQSPATMEFGSTQIIKESVEAGLGITLLSHWAVRKEIKLGTLNRLTLKGQPVEREFSLVRIEDQLQTKALQVFLEILRAHRGLPELD